jgi:predicted DNA-binding transcriptional regulator YafY
MTSKELALHFEVSRRTVFRDLRALSESGVPLTYAEGGGYEILEGYQLPPLMLSAREAATLLMGTEFMKLQPDASLREDAGQVELKIRSVLPEEVREYIDTLKNRTVLDPYWLYSPDDMEGEKGRWYELSEAVANQKSVIMEYLVQSRNEMTKRTVDPLGLVYYTDHWNLIAFDHLRKTVRNFRLDNIRSMHVLMERFEPPAGFDLAEFVKESGGDERREVVLRFSKEVYRWARRSLPAEIDREEEDNDHVRVSFYFENMEYVAQWLVRWRTGVFVEEPDVLAELVREEALAMAALYDGES